MSAIQRLGTKDRNINPPLEGEGGGESPRVPVRFRPISATPTPRGTPVPGSTFEPRDTPVPMKEGRFCKVTLTPSPYTEIARRKLNQEEPPRSYSCIPVQSEVREYKKVLDEFPAALLDLIHENMFQEARDLIDSKLESMKKLNDKLWTESCDRYQLAPNIYLKLGIKAPSENSSLYWLSAYLAIGNELKKDSLNAHQRKEIELLQKVVDAAFRSCCVL